MRPVKLFFLLLIFTGISLCVFRITLLETLITKGFAKAGAQNTHFQLANLGISQSRIKLLKTTFTLAGGKKITVTLQDVFLDYSLQQLLNTKKLSQITIDHLTIHQQNPAEKINKPFTLPSEFSLGNKELRQKIPVHKFQVNNLQLTGDWPKQIRDKNITLAALCNQGMLSTDFSLRLNQETQLHAKAESRNEHHLKVLLTAQNQQQHFLHNTFLLNNNILSGSIDMQLSQTRALALEQTTIALPPVSGQLSGDFSLPFPLQHDSQMHTNLTFNDTRGYTVVLQAEGNPFTRQLSFALNSSNPETFLETSLTMDAHQISGEYQLQAAVLRKFLEPYFPKKIPTVKGQISGTIALPFPVTSPGDFALTSEAKDVLTPWFSGSFLHLALKGKKTDHEIILEKTSQLKATSLQYGKYRAGNMQIGLGGKLSKTGTSSSVLFNNNQLIQLTNVSLGNTAIDIINGQTSKPLHIFTDNNTWSLTPTAITLQPMLVTEHARIFSFGKMQLDIHKLEHAEKSINLITALSTPVAKYRDAQRTIPLKNFECFLTLKNTLLKADLQFSPESIPGRLQLAVTHDINKARGSMRLRTSKRLNLDREGITLAHIYTPWHFPFTLDKGKIAVKAAGKWAKKNKNPFNLSAFVSVKDGEGVYKKFLFKGLNVRQDLVVLPRLYSKSEGSFSLQHLIGAIDITDIRSKLNFVRSTKGKKPQIIVTDFSATLFDGRITSPKIIYDQNQPDTTVTIDLKDIDLKQIIELVKMNNLQVTGKISGTLPITIGGKDISMKKGILLNEPPGGEIHYTAAGIDASSMTGYALKAVENFQYNSLQATASYLPSGQLALDISLQGHSPSLDTNRPVHFNIHAEQNLPALMQSLRFSKGLTDELDKRVKQHYQ